METNKGLTVNELFVLCKEQIEKGNGNKHILISCDDEGNGFHTLFYAFTDDTESIREYYDWAMFHDNNNLNEVILLG